MAAVEGGVGSGGATRRAAALQLTVELPNVEAACAEAESRQLASPHRPPCRRGARDQGVMQGDLAGEQGRVRAGETAPRGPGGGARRRQQ